MSLRVVLAVSLVLALCCSSLAQSRTARDDTDNSGIIYGQGFAFAITAPQGWVLDNGSGISQGLRAVLYPEGSSWEQAVAVMYATVVPKNSAGKHGFQAEIQHDLSHSRANAPNMVVRDAPGLPIASKKQAVVKYLTHTVGGNWEAVAYIDERKSVTLLVLSARTQAQFRGALPAFRHLVGSYAFLTNQIKIEQH